MKLAGKTNIGRVRKENQDDFRAADLPGSAAWGLVCDGMGGARGGREASCTACEVIERSFLDQYRNCFPGEEQRFLENALKSANRSVFQKSIHDEALSGMGTTAVCALIRGGRIHLCHAGDSRAYLYHAGQLIQLTHDHSYVQELVDCGTITVQEAENHPQKNIITRALGVDMRVQPDYTTAVILPGDQVLLCTDGLTNMVPVAQMQQIFAQNDFFDVPDRLIEAANANGGQDNITALLMEMESAEVKHG
jgi:protein phosphatase